MNLKAATRELIIDAYLVSLRRGSFGRNLDKLSKSRKLGGELCVTPRELDALLSSMRRRNLIEVNQDGFCPTEKGRRLIKVVMAGGSFDVIHPGHLETLRKAKELGDVLVVSVARDSTYYENKKRRPVHDERQRRELVASVKFVDATVLGSEKNIFETVRFLKPDVIALGYDQFHTEKGISEGARREGVEVSIVRIGSSVPDIKTAKLLSHL